MTDLRKAASEWLRTDGCKSGSIQDRTKTILSLFDDYIRQNKDEIELSTGVPIKRLRGEINKCRNIFGIILSSYLRGIQHIAVTTAKSFLAGENTTVLNEGARLYKARKAESNYLFTKDEMFHIPFDKRCKVGNFRFSVSGLPCLYLGSSSYVCWEELGRVDFNSCNFCGYTNKEDLDIYDFSLPSYIKSFQDIKRVCAILACSLSARRDDLFKEEYILPQCFFQALILRHYYNHRIFGVKYISVHVLNGDADCFDIDFTDDKWIGRFMNYVFPAASSEKEGYNEKLESLFMRTDTTSLFRESLLSPDKLIAGSSNDVYLDSQFGLMDAYMDAKMGYVPFRKEVTFLTL